MAFKKGDGLYYFDIVNSLTKFKLREVIHTTEKDYTRTYKVVKVEGRRVWMRRVDDDTTLARHG